jgi:segregation and condensation protein A
MTRTDEPADMSLTGSAAPSITAVRFVDEARPEFATLVQVATFDGPLGLLLTLIEQRQLDILTVPLGDLAGAFLEALAALPGERLPHVSTFVNVAAHLILIKSRAMLPAPPAGPETVADETPDPEAELRERLLIYRRFRDAGARLGQLLEAPERLFHREGTAASADAQAAARAAPAPPMDPMRLVEALSGLVTIAPPPVEPPRLVSRSVTLAERAAAIRQALAHAPAIVLQELLGSGRDRVFMAVTFLALLELVKRREVVAVQAVPWGPIECRLAPVRPSPAPAAPA